MSTTLQDLSSIFQTGEAVMNGAQQVVNVTQNAINNVQDVSRRSFGQTFNTPTMQMNSGMIAPPMTFTPYPGFWDESYGK